MYNYIIYKQFLHFSKFVFFLNKQCENYSFNYFLCFHITITLKSNFTKERRMNTYGHIIIHVYEYLCVFMYIYTYLYVFMHKKFFTINK